VSLLFALPDGGAPLHLKAVFSRAEPDGHIFTFVNLSDAEFKRLADYSRSAALSVTVRPVQAAAPALTGRWSPTRRRRRHTASHWAHVPVCGALRVITTSRGSRTTSKTPPARASRSSREAKWINRPFFGPSS